MRIWDIAIIGAGASGLAAAAEASSRGLSVLVLEKNHVPGRKILSTGAGKCNFTNEKISVMDYSSLSGDKEKDDFLNSALSLLPPQEIIRFFENIGLMWKKAETGKIFPLSMKAHDVADVLVKQSVRKGAEIRLLTNVSSIRQITIKGDRIFSVRTEKVPPQWQKNVKTTESGEEYAKRIIVAAGSPCYPQIGGTAAGYGLLLNLGHSLTDIMPVIVPLKVKGNIKDIDGVRTDALVRFIEEDKEIAKSFGEIIFARNCLSGPAVLDCSRKVQFALQNGKITAVIDFFTDYSEGELASMLESRTDRLGKNVRFCDFISGMHNYKLLSAIGKMCGIPEMARISSLGEAKYQAFCKSLKSLEFEISGSADFDSAVVAAGGIPVNEINPGTFESRITKGVYITGEIIDIDGRTGGFNLHFAWTSGILAARAAAASLK